MVIAIIMILIMLLFPAVNGVRDKGRAVLCMGHMKQLAAAHILYSTEHGGRLAGAMTSAKTDWVAGGDTMDAVTNGALWPYLNDLRVYKCPVFVSNLYFRGYSINNFVGGDDWWFNDHNNDPCFKAGFPCAHRFGAIPRPASTWTFCEEVDYRSYLQGSFVVYVLKSSWIDPIAYFHNMGANFTFADGHAEYWKWNDARTSIPGESHSFFVSQSANPDLLRLQKATCPGLSGAPE